MKLSELTKKMFDIISDNFWSLYQIRDCAIDVQAIIDNHEETKSPYKEMIWVLRTTATHLNLGGYYSEIEHRDEYIETIINGYGEEEFIAAYHITMNIDDDDVISYELQKIK